MENYKKEFIEFMIDCNVLKLETLLQRVEERHLSL